MNATAKRYGVVLADAWVRTFVFNSDGVLTHFTEETAEAARISSKAFAECIAKALGGKARELKVLP